MNKKTLLFVAKVFSRVGTFESSLGSRRMSFKRTTCAYESLSQVGYLRVDRARGLMWGSGVVVYKLQSISMEFLNRIAFYLYLN